MRKLVTFLYKNEEEREIECDFLTESICPNCIALQDGNTTAHISMDGVLEVWEEDMEEEEE